MSGGDEPSATRLEPLATAARSVPQGSFPRWLALGSIAVAAVIVISWVFLAVVHADDRSMLDHVAGTRMALARYAADGTLYPELYDDGAYGGTRFMPLPIVAHAVAAELTGEYLTSGKVVSYALMVVLLVGMGILLRGFGCPTALVVLLPALVLTTSVGYSA